MNKTKTKTKTIKPSITVAIMGAITMIIALTLFLTTIYISEAPSTEKLENLIDSIYILGVALLFFAMSCYLDHSGT